jgi:hypothetical protein
MAIKIPIISEYDKRGQNDAETGLNKLGKSAKTISQDRRGSVRSGWRWRCRHGQTVT